MTNLVRALWLVVVLGLALVLELSGARVLGLVLGLALWLALVVWFVFVFVRGSFWVVGKRYFIRTVTMYIVGELVEIDGHEITLMDAAWVPDTGRFSEALKTGVVRECEPYPDGLMVVGRGSIVDAGPWDHDPLRMVI